MLYGSFEAWISCLLRVLAPEVPAVLHALGADHRQRHVVPHAGRLLSREQVPRRRFEELEHRLLVERRRVGHVHHDLRTL